MNKRQKERDKHSQDHIESVAQKAPEVLAARYCSWCLQPTDHLLYKAHKKRRNVYQCSACGNYTLPCRLCDNMAKGASKETINDFFSWDDELCAQHDGTVKCLNPDEIALSDITEFKRLLDHETPGFNLSTHIGKYILSDYFGEDERFDIVKLSKNVPSNPLAPTNKVILINGFLKEKDKIFRDWLKTYDEIPDNTEIYGLTWASKTMGDLARSFLSPKIANLASKKLILAQLAYSAITNPWHVSMKKAKDAGILLGNILLHTEDGPFTLVAHSLGCRVIYYALEFLKNHPQVKVKDVILLGGAVGNNRKDWEEIADKINGTIYNCHSDNDDVLHKAYNLATLKLSSPIGYYPIKSDHENIVNIDCTDIIPGHNEWKNEYPQVYKRILASSQDNS